MRKYLDYNFEDLSIDEQEHYIREATEAKQISTEVAEKLSYQRQQRLNAWHTLLEKFKTPDNQTKEKWIVLDKELLKLDPFNIDSLINRAKAFGGPYNDASLAIDYYNAALQLDSTRIELTVDINKLQKIVYDEKVRLVCWYDRTFKGGSPTNQIGYAMDVARTGLNLEHWCKEVLRYWKEVSTTPNSSMLYYKDVGSAYKGLKDEANALYYFNSYIANLNSINNHIYYDHKVYYERGLIYSSQGKVDLAIADFRKAAELSEMKWPQPRIALREEHRKQNIRLREEAILKAKKEEEDKRKKLEKQKEHEKNLKQAAEFEVAALKAYEDANIDLVISFCNKAIDCCAVTQLAYLYKALVHITKNERAKVITNLKQLKAAGFKDIYIDQLLKMLVDDEQAIHKKLKEHQHWLKELLPTICDAAIEGAINGLEPSPESKLEKLPAVCKHATMHIGKKTVLLKLLEQTIVNSKVLVPKIFSKYDQEVLVYQISQALQPFFLPKKPFFGKAPPAVHFSIKTKHIDPSKKIDPKLLAAINGAIVVAKKIETPKADHLALLEAQAATIDRRKIAVLINLIHQNHFKQININKISALFEEQAERIQQTIISAQVKIQQPPALLPHRPSRTHEHSLSPRTTSIIIDTQITELKKEVEPSQELADQLAILAKMKKDTADEQRKLKQQFNDLEPKAIKLKDKNFYIVRGDFYYELALQESMMSRQYEFFANASQDYHQASLFAPSAIDARSRVVMIESQLNNGAQQSSSLFFGSQPSLSEEQLTEEERAEVERIKQRLRKEQQETKIDTAVTLQALPSAEKSNTFSQSDHLPATHIQNIKKASLIDTQISDSHTQPSSPKLPESRPRRNVTPKTKDNLNRSTLSFFNTAISDESFSNPPESEFLQPLKDGPLVRC